MFKVTSLLEWRRQWQPTPVVLLGKSHGRRSLVGCSPWGLEESDTTERIHFHFLLSCIGEGNGNPFQCSRLENPRDGGTWWAAVYGVTQSQTRLKQLSSSSTLGMKEKIQISKLKMQLSYTKYTNVRKRVNLMKWKEAYLEYFALTWSKSFYWLLSEWVTWGWQSQSSGVGQIM